MSVLWVNNAFASLPHFLCEKSLKEQISNPDSRSKIIENLRSYYQEQSSNLKTKIQNSQDSYINEYDVVLIGGGPASISFVAGLRQTRPHLRVLIIEESHTLSPVFEGPGKALVFNSMTINHNIEPINTHVFPKHFIQLLDFKEFKDHEKIHPSGEDIAALTWSQFSKLNSDLLLNTKATGISLSHEKNSVKIFTSENFYIKGKLVILTTGQGSPNTHFLPPQDRPTIQNLIKVSQQSPHELGVETYLQALNYINSNQLDPRKYENKKVAIIGGGDAAFGLVEILLALNVPTKTFGINSLKRRPSRLVNYGANVLPPNMEQFRRSTKERYHHLRGLGGLFLKPNLPLPSSVEDLRTELGKSIEFKTEKVINILPIENNLFLIKDSQGDEEVFDHVILATGYVNESSYFLNAKFRTMSEYNYNHLPEELVPLHGPIVIQGGSYQPGRRLLSNTDILYPNARLGFQFKNFPVFLLANAAGANLIVHDNEAGDGTFESHHKKEHIPHSATDSKYTMQNMLPRTFSAGKILSEQYFHD